MTPIRRLAVAATVLLLCSSVSAFALTEEQCQFFAVDGRTAICHATGSPHQPFVPLELVLKACIHHVPHDADHVAVGDTECQGSGCLPAGAPCDATLPCCSGLACNTGICDVPLEGADAAGLGDSTPACAWPSDDRVDDAIGTAAP